jgi:IS30 family transposase
MPRWAHNKMPTSVKKRYFELLRQGYKSGSIAHELGRQYRPS